MRPRRISWFAITCEFLRRRILTCDLGFDLTLHLQRVDEDAAVADEACAGYSSVGLAEALFVKVVPETTKIFRCFCRRPEGIERYTQIPLEGSVGSGFTFLGLNQDLSYCWVNKQQQQQKNLTNKPLHSTDT